MRMDEWSDDFFSELALDALFQTYSVEKTLADCDLISQFFQLCPNFKLLDVPCGTGRISLEMAKRGCKVLGIDRVSGLIKHAQAQAAAANLSADFKCVDIRKLKLTGKFAGAICYGSSFGYHSDEENIKFLSSIASCLSSKGRFLLQTTLIAESILNSPLGRSWQYTGDVLMLRDQHYDVQSGRLQTKYRFIKSNQIEHKFASFRVYTIRELIEIFHKIGFSNIQCYGDSIADFYKLGQKKLHILAYKA